MSDELFDVVFFGILQAGKDKETVMQNMAALFKTEPAKLAPYFAGGRKVIKGKINAEAAAKYQTALENVGLVIKLEPCEAASQTPSSTSDNTDNDQANSAADNSGITMAAVGADVLENPVPVIPQKIDDISDLTMAEAGVDVIENPVQIPAQKIEELSDITVAELGADVLEHHEEIVAPVIEEIPGISIAEAGADLSETKIEIKAVIPDTSELTLSDEIDKENT